MIPDAAGRRGQRVADSTDGQRRVGKKTRQYQKTHRRHALAPDSSTDVPFEAQTRSRRPRRPAEHRQTRTEGVRGVPTRPSRSLLVRSVPTRARSSTADSERARNAHRRRAERTSGARNGPNSGRTRQRGASNAPSRSHAMQGSRYLGERVLERVAELVGHAAQQLGWRRARARAHARAEGLTSVRVARARRERARIVGKVLGRCQRARAVGLGRRGRVSCNLPVVRRRVHGRPGPCALQDAAAALRGAPVRCYCLPGRVARRSVAAAMRGSAARMDGWMDGSFPFRPPSLGWLAAEFFEPRGRLLLPSKSPTRE